MSEALRVALVTEGPTDAVVIEAALQAMAPDHHFVVTTLQPEGSLVFGPLGGGWAGVYRWCRQAAGRGRGCLAAYALLLENFDLVILHLDADVADRRYSDASITPEPGDGVLPCSHPCPPPCATTDPLRDVLLSWCGGCDLPSRAVICMPSKSMEAWILAALFPDDKAVAGQNLECLADPESRLGVQRKSRRIRKSLADYRRNAAGITEAWPRLADPNGLGEAMRFQTDILAAFDRITRARNGASM